MSTSSENKQLIAVFTEQGFSFDFDPSSKTKGFAPNSVLEELYQSHGESPNHLALHLGFLEPTSGWAPSVIFLNSVAQTFINRLSKTPNLEETREKTVVHPTALDLSNLQTKMPFMLGMEFITPAWLKQVFCDLNQAFAAEISEFSGTVAEYLHKRNANITVFGRIYFHLVENKEDENYPFAFLATYSTRATENRKAAHTPLKNALLEYKGQDELLLKLLSTVSSAAKKSNLVAELVESGELFSPLKFTSGEAYTFLQEVPLYEDCGILCRIPDWWKQKSSGFRLAVNVGERRPSFVGTDAFLEFDPTLYLGEETISAAELRALLAETSGLSLIKGKWIEVDREKLEATLAAYEKAKALAQSGALTINEAMRLQLNLEQTLETAKQDVPVEVTQGEWLQEVVAKMTSPSQIEDVPSGPDFKATLRTYQQTGLNWLKFMQELGMGACLADDMGLGKTVQVLALLDRLRSSAQTKSLLIIPASLMGNWQKEIKRFAPKLRYQTIYSSKDDFDLQDSFDLLITTYGMAMRLEKLQSIQWDLIILDEAQAIKNPGTKQTKAIKLLDAKAKIALTGTPIENTLSDLWSLFDFLNAGLLGTAREFNELVKTLEQSDRGYARLRKVISPFILRRLKTDKTIISDLPEKIESEAYIELAKKQIVLYQGLVTELAEKLESAEGIGRKGLVLASITKAKQICNHPDQYLGQSQFSPSQSGKFQRLGEICETIAEKRERVLVFTQFREMTEPLAAFLAQVFKREGLILHGGTPVKKRAELVDHFCGSEYVPFMVLSLRAGGVGLNLTAANHVIHFDRWWNPAVENQATDRVFRIGQEKNVVVHKFTTLGTIEEKISQMIAEKTQLAEEILASTGENWLTELNNEELMDFFTLTVGGAD